MHLVRHGLRALLVAGVAFAAPLASAQTFINVLTGGTSGVYYPLGVALANVIGKSIPNVKTSVQATKASVENLNLLEAGRGEIAFTLGDSLSDAWKGNGLTESGSPPGEAGVAVPQIALVRSEVCPASSPELCDPRQRCLQLQLEQLGCLVGEFVESLDDRMEVGDERFPDLFVRVGHQ